jgi:mannose-6-phosphate isomerase-like protein (cupin superfamily)
MPQPPFTLKRLTEVEDSAERFGLSEVQEARFAHSALDASDTGLSYHRLKPNCRQAFAHRHDEAEEVYVVLAGAGRAKLDDEIVELAVLDALRVAPPVVRCFEAGPDGLDVLAIGARREGDGELIRDWWTD